MTAFVRQIEIYSTRCYSYLSDLDENLQNQVVPPLGGQRKGSMRRYYV